jgi:hypothetical protein
MPQMQIGLLGPFLPKLEIPIDMLTHFLTPFMNTYPNTEEPIPVFSKRMQELHCKEFYDRIVSREFVASRFTRTERVSFLQARQATELSH